MDDRGRTVVGEITQSNVDSIFWIDKLNLQAHPEGGYYHERFRSDSGNLLGEPYKGYRAFSTSIYFLMTQTRFSKFHRLKSDEIWYYHYGNDAIIHVIDYNGIYYNQHLGIGVNSEPQIIINKGSWFAATPIFDYTLLSCNVAPGFDFEDFELADRNILLNKYPELQEIIIQFT